jgi:hypothetical protein
MDILSDIKEMSEILGKENIDCLAALFEEIKGQPPRINKKRYRADHSEQIESLNYLENSVHLIKTETIKTEQFYQLRAYALPLIKTSKAQKLLNLMSEIYQILPTFYKERLDAPVTTEELLKAVDAPTDSILEALAYFKDTHDILGGWGIEFPYKEKSQINLSEKVILKSGLLEILTDYYRWNFIGKKESFLPDINKRVFFTQEIKIEDKKSGRPSLEKKIIEAYETLKNKKAIDYSKTLKAHEKIIQETAQIEGISYKTISKYLGKRFKEDKKSIN